MANPLIKAAVRTRFSLTSRQGACKQALRHLESYLLLAETLDDTTGRRPVTVPPMMGVDEDMRGWSFFMLLRHNTIVNRAISANVKRLALGEPPPAKRFDPKKDVMPEPDCGIGEVGLFKASVLAHVESVKSLEKLRGTATTNHPLFGPFDAHKWHCMFAFHMQVHMKQAESVARGARA